MSKRSYFIVYYNRIDRNKSGVNLVGMLVRGLVVPASYASRPKKSLKLAKAHAVALRMQGCFPQFIRRYMPSGQWEDFKLE